MTNKSKPTHSTNFDECWQTIGVWGKSEERGLCPRLKEVVHCHNCPVYSAAGRRLLDREPPAEYIQEWTGILAKEKSVTETDSGSAFIFRAGGEWLALPATLIQEVVNMGLIHTLPHRSTNILRGVVNIRGKLEICLSIGGVLGLEREEFQQLPGFRAGERLIVARREGLNIVFPVSEVMGIIRFTSDMLRNLPVTVSGAKANFTRGILCIKDQDIGFLDDKILFETLTRSLE
ncbi:chemotaxis protein CheW [Thermodesulfobacteriota bacterium]